MQSPLTSEALDEVSTEREELYQCRLTEGLMVPILVRQSDIKYGVPSELEVETAVKGLREAERGFCQEYAQTT